MKTALGLILVLAFVAFAGLSQAAPRVGKRVTKKVLKKSPSALDKRLSTDVSFDGSVVSGKYQFPDEAVATVEDEKSLDDLLGVRKHFKDRLSKSLDRN